MNDASPLSRYVTPLRRWWYVVLAALAIGLVVTWITLPESPTEQTADALADPDTTYRATHLLIGDPEATNFPLIEVLAQQGDLATRVMEAMDGQVEMSDIDELVMETNAEIGTISITATQDSPELAASLATTYAEELQGLVDERGTASLRQAADRISDRLPNLAVEIELNEEELASLEEGSLERRLLEAEQELLITDFAAAQAEARSLESQLAMQQSSFTTLQEPSPVATELLDDEGLSAVPTSPLPRFAAFGLLAAVAGMLLAFGIDYLDTRLRTREDVEAAFGLPVIAELPPRSRRNCEEEPIPVVSDPGGVTAESFRALRLSVMFAPRWRLAGTAPTSNGSVGSVAPVERRHQPQALLVTSSLLGDGKSTTAANLAASFAESGQRVLVIDCDFRRPSIGGLLRPGSTASRGLTEVDERALDELDQLTVATDVAGVQLVPSGESGRAPAWFVDSAGVLVARARALADVVIFDAGPLALTNEASALIPAVDAVLVVTRAGGLTRAQARGTMEHLTRLGASVAGIVVVGVSGVKRYGQRDNPIASMKA
jgi:Mrp family chromosome partitioning ATPase/capsular polysaccharide biosynthesis protein